ncbi:hypothetical protein PV325_007987 [Microctonus aethiopoides]|nr:hypothetical protein PV325_007987 [Microctonus aethiopoides]
MVFQLIYVVLLGAVLIQAHPLSETAKNDKMSRNNLELSPNVEDSSKNSKLSELSSSEADDDQSNENLTEKQQSEECELLLEKLIFVIYKVKDEDMINKNGYINQLKTAMDSLCKDKTIFRRLRDFA